MTHDNEVFTAREIAKLFRVHPETVKKWCERGQLKGFKTLGGQWRIRWRDVKDQVPHE